MTLPPPHSPEALARARNEAREIQRRITEECNDSCVDPLCLYYWVHGKRTGKFLGLPEGLP